ncbi:MAG TPA: M56 family metallopeptidase [Verrucomicrobiae bacterium]|nr:M56 family metallopeptidase [Verrucomicrobiae bacterium]
MDALLLSGLWQGAPIAAIAWLVTLALPRRHAATRYAVWFTALLALAIVPLVTLWHTDPLPALPAPVVITASATTAATAHVANLAGLWLALLWGIGAGACAVRLALSYARIRRIIANATPAPELGENVVISGDVTLPISAGFIKPSIVIPSSIVATLDDPDLTSVLLHERAHIERGDIITNLIQRVIEALLFFNPWVYLAGRALVREREAACDDRVVVATGESDRYATCLTKLAQRGARHTPLLTPSAIGSRRMLVARVARLLNGKAARVKINYFVPGFCAALFGVLAFALQTAGSFAQSSTPNQHLGAACDHGVRVLKAAPPNYPGSARTKGPLHADALVTVAADGDVVSAKIVTSSGDPAVDKATLDAAEASTYAPAVGNCKAKEGSYLFHAEFNPA